VWWHAAATAKSLAVSLYGEHFILIQNQVLATMLRRLSPNLGTRPFDLAKKGHLFNFDQRRRTLVPMTAHSPYAIA
jgi:hypothetical protein